jgi:protein KRI1
MATDQELNEYMSVKKYAPYRKDVKWDSKRVDRLKEFKSNISQRVSVSGTGEGNNTDKPTKKRRGKKERSKLKNAVGLNPSPAELGGLDVLKRGHGDDDLAGNAPEPENHGKKKRRRKEPQAGEE